MCIIISTVRNKQMCKRKTKQLLRHEIFIASNSMNHHNLVQHLHLLRLQSGVNTSARSLGCNWVTCIVPPTEDWGCITKQSSVCIPVSVDRRRLEQKCFQLTTKSSGWSQQSQLSRQPVPCSQCGDRESLVANTLHNKARSADWAGIVGTDVSKSEMQTGMCERSDLWTIRHNNLYWILSATGNQCNSWRAMVTWPHGLRSRTVRAAACRTQKWYQCGSWKIRQHGIAVVKMRQDKCSNNTSIWPSWCHCHSLSLAYILLIAEYQ